MHFKYATYPGPTPYSEADVREMEKVIVSMVKAENQDIKSKHDVARLLIDHCQLTLINVHSPPSTLQTDIKDSPLTQVTSSGMVTLWHLLLIIEYFMFDFVCMF